MKCIPTLLIAILIVATCGALENIMQGDVYECVKCLCHSVSGCHKRENCAKYSISKEYWKDANSPVVDAEDSRDSEESYRKCMADENCIVHTIKAYTDRYMKDCNCDGKIDCKDRLSIHLGLGRNCINPYYGKIKASRFNTCAKSIQVKFMDIDEPNCEVTPE